MQVSESDYSRIIAVGDLHGHYEPFERLLRKLNTHDSDLLIFIGDYVDRGPEVKILVQKLIEFKLLHPNVIFLKGNHEDMMLGSLGFPAVINDMNTWLYNGGTATLLSYGLTLEKIDKVLAIWDDGERAAALMDAIPKGHIEFLRSLLLYVETENYFFCHAGINPNQTIEEGKNNPYDLLWMRDHIYFEDRRWEKTVICGHTPLQEVLKANRLICIDTGLHYFGKLTAFDIGTGEIYQVGLY